MRAKTIGIMVLAVFVIVTVGKQKKEDTPTSPAGTDRKIEEAVSYAYGLEQELFSRESGITEKTQVYELFRKGFSERLALELADYYWLEGEDSDGELYAVLRSGEPVFIPADKLMLLKADGETADVLLKYSASREGPVTYRAHSVKVKLRLEADVWKVYDADTSWF